MLNRLICLILGYFIGAIIQTGFWIGKFKIKKFTLGTVTSVHLERKPDL